MSAEEVAASGTWTDSGNYASSFAGGSSTEGDPYQIAAAEQFAYLVKVINDTSTNISYANRVVGNGLVMYRDVITQVM